MAKKRWLGMACGLMLVLWGCTPEVCVTCDNCPSGVQLESEELCDNDFNSTTDYQAAIELAESYGCTCE